MRIKDIDTVLDPFIPVWINQDDDATRYSTWDEAREAISGDTVIEYITIDGDGYLTTEI